jgi:plastocyanin
VITRRTLAGLIAALAVACGAAAAGARESKHEISMRGNSFGPRRLDVAPGDTVVWINRDIVRHDATAPGRFESGELRAGERYEWVAADTGVIQYRCTIHQRMRGEIRVREAK